MSKQSFQELFGSDNHCFGCGMHNGHGLRIKSFWDGDYAVAIFNPQSYHCAGSTTIVNGGILGALIDCHCNCFAIADAYKREGCEMGTNPKIWYVTANLNVSYKKPVAIDTPIYLKAVVSKIDGRKTWMSCELFSKDALCVTGEVLSIRLIDK